jgi:hypothetical protein
VSYPYTQQQNGIVKRKHRHIVEMGLALLTTASMPLKFWDQAFLAATHLINRTPTKLLAYDIPLHRLLGATPNYSSIRVFWCTCWPNLRPYNSHELPLCSLRCVFIGYINLHKGYTCLDISTGCVYISRDVIFDEAIFPFSELKPNTGARYIAEVLLLPNERATLESSMTNILPNTIMPAPVWLPCLPVHPQKIPMSDSAPIVGLDPGADPLPILPCGTNPGGAAVCTSRSRPRLPRVKWVCRFTATC